MMIEDLSSWYRIPPETGYLIPSICNNHPCTPRSFHA